MHAITPVLYLDRLLLSSSAACPRCAVGAQARAEALHDATWSHVAALVVPFLLVVAAALRMSRRLV